MFLIDDDQAPDRGTAGTGRIARPTTSPAHRPAPTMRQTAAAFGHGHARMPFGGAGAEPCLHPRQELRRQGDLGQQNQRLPPRAQRLGHGFHIDLGLA